MPKGPFSFMLTGDLFFFESGHQQSWRYNTFMNIFEKLKELNLSNGEYVAVGR